MIIHNVKVFPSKVHLPKKKQLAWKIAEIASDNAKLDKDAIEMVINRIIDNASVAIASLNRRPVILLEDGYTEKNTTEIYHNHLIKDFIGIEKIVTKYL